MKDINLLIDKYGETIIKTLKITSSQVYEKILFYIRITAILEWVKIILSIAFFFGLRPLIHKHLNKFFEDDWKKDFWLVFLFDILLLIFINVLVFLLTENLIKVISPEYWIIYKILQKSRF